jgi:hypothetical protein
MEAFKTDHVRLYETVKNSGHLRGIALDVFGIICSKPGLTAGEIFREYAALRPNTTRARNEIAKRVNDLANWGGVEAAGTTICPESGRKAARWVPTGEAPNRFQPLRIAKLGDELKRASASADLKTQERVAYYQTLIAKLGTDNDLLKESNSILARDLSSATSEVQQLRDTVSRKQGDIEVMRVAVANSRLENQSLVAQSTTRDYSNYKAKAQLEALASRSRFILKLPRLFVTKRLRTQAQETLSALEAAIKALS